jgi:hypothetical protein
MSALFEVRATKERVLHLRECPEHVFAILFFETNIIMSDLSCTPCEYIALVQALGKVSIEFYLIVIYFHSFEIFNIQIGEMAFCKPDFIIIKSSQ